MHRNSEEALLLSQYLFKFTNFVTKVLEGEMSPAFQLRYSAMEWITIVSGTVLSESCGVAGLRGN